MSSLTKIGTTKKIIVDKNTINTKREIKIPTQSPIRYLLSFQTTQRKERELLLQQQLRVSGEKG